MSGLKKLIHEIHRRSLWQLLAKGHRRSLLTRAYCLALACLACGAEEDPAHSRGSAVTVFIPSAGLGMGRIAPEGQAKFLVYLPLVNFDEEGELEGRLARSWEHSPDYREWTFHLRSDVRWHDGVPVTARDIEFTMKLLNGGVFQHYAENPYGGSITVLDDSTLTIRRTEPQADALDGWTVYYPKHLLEELDPEEFWGWDFWSHPVGNGPYRYVRHVPQTMVELEANPDYYGGKPEIDRVVVKFGAGASLPELLSGNVDALMGFGAANIPKLAEDPRFRVYHHIWPEVGWLLAIYWNHRDPLFRGSAVRRALTLAINRRELLRVINYPADLAISDVLFTGRQYWRRQLPEPLPYDPARAKQLLEEAGWRDVDGNGIRERDGEEFHFEATVGAGGELERAAVYVQEQLRKVGIRMEVQILEGLVVQERLRSGNYQAALHVLQNQPAGPNGQLAWFGEASRIGYDNPRVAELLHAAGVAADPEERDRIYRELTPIFRAELPFTFLSAQVETFVAHRRLQGLSSPFRAIPVMNMEHLWIEDDER